MRWKVPEPQCRRPVEFAVYDNKARPRYELLHALPSIVLALLWSSHAAALDQPTASMLADQQLQQSVTDALEADPYFYVAT